MEKSEKTIHAARRQKRGIERRLEDQLIAFTKETGLLVKELSVDIIDGGDVYIYNVTSEIVIHD